MLRRHWRLAAVVGVQLAILAAIPARKVAARLRGTEVVLRTVPVDPYDLLSGYYVTLRYEAGDVPHELRSTSGRDVWVTLERDEPAWRAVGVETEPPAPESGRVGLRGVLEGRRIRFPGIERFYAQETQAPQIEQAIRGAGGHALVHVRVQADGEAALVKLRVGERTWGG